MMKIITNLQNVDALKVITAAEYNNYEIELELRPKDSADSGDRATCILPNQLQIHQMTTAASWIMHTKSDHEPSLINQFIETDICLSNLINQYLKNSREDIKIALFKVISNIDAKASHSRFLIGDRVSLADICIWCSLSLLIENEESPLLKPYPHLKKWFKKMKAEPQIQNSLKKLGFSDEKLNLSPAHDKKEKPSTATYREDDYSNAIISKEEIQEALENYLNGPKKRPIPKKKSHPVLPVEGEKNILITSSLPYVNNVPHLGNIIGCVLSADVFARFSRLRNYNTLYICGTDEYGTATETKALEEGLTPQAICDKYHAIHRDIYEWFMISFDHFGRTTTPNQTEITQELFLRVRDQGYISTNTVEQLYCENCNRFLADRLVEGICPNCKYDDARGDQCDGCGHLINATELIKPRCKLCSKSPVIKDSEQFFLELDKLENTIKQWFDVSSKGWTNNARVITKSWIKDGLKPRCITRDLNWGIKVPLKGFEKKVFYVWFDAPIGYLSITSQYTEHWRKWWQPTPQSNVSLYNFMAKDNVPFHSIMFPATLLAANQNWVLVKHIMATEYLNYEDGKFSKSRGVGIFGNDARDTGIPVDVWRFYLLYVRPENQDSNFNWSDLILKNNSELLNNLGNFINRALVFAVKNFDGKVPHFHFEEKDHSLLVMINRELKSYINALEQATLRDGLRIILNLSRIGNQYMQSEQPWVLVKGNEQEKVRAGTVINLCCNLVALLSVLMEPYMPNAAKQLKLQLNSSDNIRVLEPDFTCLLTPDHKLGNPSPLFIKIESIEGLKERFSGQSENKTIPKPNSSEAQPKSIASPNSSITISSSKIDQIKSQITEQITKINTLKETKSGEEFKNSIKTEKRLFAKHQKDLTFMIKSLDKKKKQIKSTSEEENIKLEEDLKHVKEIQNNLNEFLASL